MKDIFTYGSSMAIKGSFVSLCVLVWILGVFSLAAASDYRVFCGGLPVINYLEEGCEPKGIAVDILMEIMTEVGHPLALSDFKCLDWNEAMKEVEKDPKAMLISAVLTPDREARFSWVGPVARANMGLIGRKSDAIRITGPESLAGLKTAVIRNSAPLVMLRAMCSKCGGEGILVVDSNKEQFTFLREGKVDLIGHADLGAPLLLKAYGFDPDEYEMVRVLSKTNLYILLNRQTDPDLVHRMQEAFDNMSREHLEEIYERHLGDQRLSIRRD